MKFNVPTISGVSFKGILHIFHLPPCRSEPIKALFVIGTQYKIFWINIIALPYNCQVNYTVKVQESMKSIARVLQLPSVVQSDRYEATRIPFVPK